MGSLSMAKSWLDTKLEATAFIYFSASEDAGVGRIFATISRDVWEDMGEPESITVAVKPGHDFDFSS